MNTAEEVFLKDTRDSVGEGEGSGPVCLELRVAWKCCVSSTRQEWLKTRKRDTAAQLEIFNPEVIRRF